MKERTPERHIIDDGGGPVQFFKHHHILLINMYRCCTYLLLIMSKTTKKLLYLSFNCSNKFLIIFLLFSSCVLLLQRNTTTTLAFSFFIKQQKQQVGGGIQHHHYTTTTTTTTTTKTSFGSTTVIMMASSSSSSSSTNERDGDGENNNNEQSTTTTDTRNKKATTTTTTMTVFGTVPDDSIIANEIIAVAAPSNDNDSTTTTQPQPSIDNDDSTTTTTTTTTQQQPLLLLADFCPFACRAYIAMLEKDLTYNNIQHVCYVLGPKKDIGTKMLYELSPTISKAVPVLIHKQQQIFCESMAIVEYIDDLYPNNINALQPSDPIMKYNMRIFIDRYSGLIGYFYKLLKCQDSKEQIEISNNLTTLLQKLEIDLQLFDNGPYLCGKQFTLADIQIFPFMERIIVVLKHYRRFQIEPKEDFVHVWKWYEACTNRPSIKIAISDRNENSMKIYNCYEKRLRNDYLNEVYECYSYNEIEYCKKLTIESTAEPGINVYAAEKIRNRKQQEQQKDEAATNNTNGINKKRKVPP